MSSRGSFAQPSYGIQAQHSSNLLIGQELVFEYFLKKPLWSRGVMHHFGVPRSQGTQNNVKQSSTIFLSQKVIFEKCEMKPLGSKLVIKGSHVSSGSVNFEQREMTVF